MRFRRIRARAWRALFWGLVLILTSLAGGLWFAFAYVTDSATLAGLMKAESPRYLPGARLELGHVRVRPFIGEINVTMLALRQTIDGKPFQMLRVPWLHIRLNPRALLRREFVPKEVVVAQPTLRLCRRADGTWNLQGVLADPFPAAPTTAPLPPILIQNGTVELCEGTTRAMAAILRDVTVRIESAGGDRLQFEGTAKGDALDRLSLQGTIERGTGRVTLKGDVARLAISETFRARLPAEVRAGFDKVGLTRGEVDLRLGGLTYDPAAHPAIRYDASARVRSGALNCPKLPFPINELSASVSVRDGVLSIERAEGYNGSTTVRVGRGSITLGDPARAPLDLKLDVIDVELDRRLRDWTPPDFAELWDDFQPQGRLSAAVHVVRTVEGGPVGFGWGIDCRDVAILYRHFRYPLDHLQGRLAFEKQRIAIDLHTLIGGKPLHARGTIDNPGPDAHVVLDFEAKALPIDRTLFDAIPPDVRKVVDQFKPTGTVSGTARVERSAPGPGDPPEGKVRIDAVLDLDERCAITWAGLPYPVTNLTGRLELHPDLWTFTDVRGGNGQAVITGNGWVKKLPGPGDPLAMDLRLTAEKLPFDDQLRSALPAAWRKTWETLNPVGSSDVDATIRLAPGQPDHYHLVIDPRPETSIRLEFSRDPKPGVDPGGAFELRMEDVKGRFVYDNGTVTMRDAGFQFHGSPVRFESGTVQVEDSGRFRLGVGGVWVRDFRLDQNLRKIMPPVMAQFARRFDDGKPLSTIKGNLALSWSGPGRPVVCGWDNVLVVFNDNTIQAGMPMEHIQGQLDHVRGRFTGEDVEVHGAMNLASVSLLGQQVTDLESPFHVEKGLAQMSDIRGKLLGGAVGGHFEVSLDATPRYTAHVAIEGADLERYARTMPGRQTFRGLILARLDLNGLGNDLRTLQGQGEAHIVQGDLGELPVALRLFNFLKLSPATKTAFDTADVHITIQNGESVLDPIKFTGNAFSLQGRGTLDVQGDLDMRLKVILGRDRMHVPIVSGVLRETTGQFFVIRVLGTPGFPKFKLEPLPRATDVIKSIGSRRRPDQPPY